MKHGKYLGIDIALQNCSKSSAYPTLLLPEQERSSTRIRFAMVAASRSDALGWPVVHIGCSLRLGMPGGVCFPVSTVAYFAQAVLRRQQW